VTRVLVVLAAVFLVNLPVVHQALTDREISSSGKDVEAVLLKARTIEGDHLVEYRLPRAVDPSRRRYSARVDATTYQQARESDVLLVQVVPGRPSANRPVGEVDNSLFAVVAVAADVVLLVVGVVLWRRWLRSSRHEVLAVADDEVTLVSRGHTVTAATPPGWVSRVQPGERVAGSLHLIADEEVQPGPPLSGLEQLHGSAYVVRGRVVGARVGRVKLELNDGFRLSVETGSYRIRADIRDSTEVHGNLCFTPSGFNSTGTD
jgi:hypothetical protein